MSLDFSPVIEQNKIPGRMKMDIIYNQFPESIDENNCLQLYWLGKIAFQK